MAKIWIDAYSKKDGTRVNGHWKEITPGMKIKSGQYHHKSEIDQLVALVKKKAGVGRKDAVLRLAKITGASSIKQALINLDYAEPLLPKKKSFYLNPFPNK